MATLRVRLIVGLALDIIVTAIAGGILWVTNTALPASQSIPLFVGIGVGTAVVANVVLDRVARRRPRQQ